MPEDKFNLQDKINNVGAETIMGAMSQFEQDGKENLEKLNEAIEEARENEANEKQINAAAMGANADLSSMLYARPRHLRPIVKDNNVRRNDPCPCGSGKKYKNCCLESGRYETYSRV
jgi:preprotein translocase subunit SecA